MSFSNDYLLNVDIKQRLAVGTPTFKQGDNGKLRFKIYNNNALFDLTGFTRAEITHRMPSNATYIAEAKLNSNNEIEYDYPTKIELGEVGFVEVGLSVYSGNDVVSVQPFKIFIHNNMRNKDLSYINVLQELIKEVQYLDVKVNQGLVDLGNKIQEVDTLKNDFINLSDTVTNAELVRENNESIRNTNENERKSNELGRLNSENLRQSTFNSKITEVDNKLLDAQLAIDNVNNTVMASESLRETNELNRENAESQRQIKFNSKISEIDESVSKGLFVLSNAYKKNNRVLDNGSTWVAKVDTQNNPLPTLPTYENTWWILEAQRGIDGSGAVSKVNGISPDATGNVNLTIPTEWNEIKNKPTEFNPSTHKHPISDVNGLQSEIDKIAILSSEIDANKQKITTHEAKIASETQLGHVKVDGKTIKVDVNGIISSVNDGIKLGEVTNLTATQNDTATQFTINWTNPVANEFLKVEAYISTSDISNSDRDYCTLNATKFAEGKVSTGTVTVTNNNLYYIKVFAMYSFLGTEHYSKGVSISKLAKDITPPSPITNLVATKGNAQVTLTWTNPTDSDFDKTKVLYKIGSYPTSHIDGTVSYDSSGNTVNVTGLSNDVEYYFRAFTYDNNGNINDTPLGQQVTAIPKAYVIYGVKIDTTNSNPETALTYTDEAVGFTSAKGNNGNFSYGSWQDKFPFNAIKPCLVKNGVVNYYLNPNDYTKKLTGEASDITSGNDGDVMVEFPKIYWKFETVGTDLYIRYSDAKVDSTYKCLAHTRGTSEKDKIYLSAYMGYELSGKLRSLSGKTPTVNQTIGQFRTLAKANSTGYEQSTYYQILMLQILFIVMFKNRDSQSALGRGYVDGNTSSIATGGTNQKGMFYGESTGKLQNKFCGVEDFWGNTYYWVDGLYSDASRNILIGNDNFNDTGGGYTNYGQGGTANLGGYIDKVQGGTETGFIIKSGSSSVTTHYADYGNLSASCLPVFGASWADGSHGGAFLLNVSVSASYSSSTLSTRLSCF